MASSAGNRLTRLRNVMSSKQVQAVIVPTDDAHASEYVAACDKRRQFISDFTGSAGTAIVTTDKAALWTDGRYFTQAEKELDLEHWTLMKQGVIGTPSETKWLSKVLDKNSKIYVDATLYSGSSYSQLATMLEKFNLTLTSDGSNPVDEIWTDRSSRTCNSIEQLSTSITGFKWDDKLAMLREKMAEVGTEFMVLSMLDDIAWTLNLRGSDIPCNPVFFSYLLVGMEKCYLYVQNPQDPGLASLDGSGVEMMEYSGATADIIEKVGEHKVWTTKGVNHEIAGRLPNQLCTSVSHACMIKACKNSAEIKSMYSANRKAARALARYFTWVEDHFKELDEVSASDKLEALYAEEEGYQGLSFATISGSGSNGAILHYKADKKTCKRLESGTTYLCDSGMQCLEGTTDTTRTLWLGDEPVDPYVRECYTRVLKGHIALANLKFPEGTRGYQVDALARKALWDVGLDYMHGTGHGIGQYLNVHEDPRSMGISYKFVASSTPVADDSIAGHDTMTHLRPNYVVSNEPGYYEVGKFGIRLENAIIVTSEQVDSKFKGKFCKPFYGFTDLIFLPYCMALIDPSLLDHAETAWMNWYSEKCLEILLPDLEDDENTKAWVLKNTVKI